MHPIHRPANPSPIRSGHSMLQSALRTMRGVKAFVTLLVDESGNLEPVWELSQSLVDSPAFQLAIAAMKTTPAMAAFLAERYMAPPHDLEALLQYPPESLGYRYASQMNQLGFQPFEPTPRMVWEAMTLPDTHYVEYRWQQTHDIWHVMTGFDTSEIGEIGLQAFYLAQFQLPLSSLLIANALISATLLQPESLTGMLDAIAQGYQMGKVASPLIAQKWEDAWEKPLTEWRSDLNLQPIAA